MLVLKKYFSEIIYLLGPDKQKLKYLIILFFVISSLELAGLGLVAPYVAILIDPDSAKSIDFFKDTIPPEILSDKTILATLFGGALVVVFFIKTAFTIFSNYVVTKFSQKQQANLRSVLMKSYQNLSYTIFAQRNSAEYVYNIQNLSEQFSNQVVLVGLRLVSDIIVAIVVTVFLAWNDPYILLLALLVAGIFIFGYDLLFGKKLKDYGVCANNASVSILQNVHEGMEGLKEIRILGKSSYFYEKVKDNSNKYGYCQTMSQVISTSPRYLLELVFILFVVSLAILIISQEKEAAEVLPVLGLYAVASIRLVPIINGLINSLSRLRYGRNAVAILYNDLLSINQARSQEKPKTTTENYSKFKTLTLEKVQFKYPNVGFYSLKSISIKIKAGESIGIIGGSGAGKTTLIDLILGLICPSSGLAKYNNEPLKDQLHNWLKHVAYLPQQVFLIDNTLKANVALGCNDIDERRVISALKKAKVFDFVQELPEGLDTKVGERGVRLSGGQRQRIALARAFYHNRDVLIMDESTSALDDNTEYEIVQEIKQYKGEKTIVAIAHRLSTLQYCDRIYNLQDGEVVSVGSYENFKK